MASESSRSPDVVHTSVIPAFRRLRQEDHEFLASMGYTVRSYAKKPSAHWRSQQALTPKVLPPHSNQLSSPSLPPQGRLCGGGRV
jgi:hypothetical protein